MRDLNVKDFKNLSHFHPHYTRVIYIIHTSMLTQNIIGYEISQNGKETLKAINPSNGEKLEGDFIAATQEDLETAALKAHQAWKIYRHSSGNQKAEFLRTIGLRTYNNNGTDKKAFIRLKENAKSRGW